MSERRRIISLEEKVKKLEDNGDFYVGALLKLRDMILDEAVGLPSAMARLERLEKKRTPRKKKAESE